MMTRTHISVTNPPDGHRQGTASNSIYTATVSLLQFQLTGTTKDSVLPYKFVVINSMSVAMEASSDPECNLQMSSSGLTLALS